MILERATPVLRVADYPHAHAFWTGLGFACVEEGGDPPRFGIFRHGAAVVFVDAWHGAEATPSPTWRAYFHTPDVAEVARVAASRDVQVEWPVDTAYGMREVTLVDADGNRLCFGQDLPG